MSRTFLNSAVIAIAALALPACGRTTTPSTPPKAQASDKPLADQPKSVAIKPVAPLQLPTPQALPERLDGNDLNTVDADELVALAHRAMVKKDYVRAADFQYWYVQKTKNGLYDLACFIARNGQIDPAFYWLQRAAIEEGVDAAHAARDPDLRLLQLDTRWTRVLQYLLECNRYFETAPIARTAIVLPKGYQKGEPIPAIVWLHGFGSNPEDFVNSGSQTYADQLHVALIGISATIARGPNSFVWTADPETDAKRLQSAIAEVRDRVTIQPGHMIAFGFSQGAQVALEAAVRQPEEFAGSISLSPGMQAHLKGLSPSLTLAQRRFVVSCGADENPITVALAAYDAEWLRSVKAVVTHSVYPGVSAHAFPRDFNKRFPEWVQFILKSKNREARAQSGNTSEKNTKATNPQ